jgi:5''-nucleotidase/2'',3''-cyclic phosphodiesterase and related esterases
MTHLTRRAFVARSSALAAAAAVTPVLVDRAEAQAAPGQLAMVAAEPNPAGTVERLWLLKGDPLAGPIREVLAEDGAVQPARLAPGERRVLRLMHFNDMHNHMTDLHPTRGDTHRMAQMVKRVAEAKRQAGPAEVVLFLTAGDDHTGSVFDELMGWSQDEFVADAGYRAASAAGVDIGVLGNHDFDRGADLLKVGIDRDCAFPLLSANVHGSAHIARDADYVAAAVAEAKACASASSG